MAQMTTTAVKKGLDFATRLRLMAKEYAPDAWTESQVQKVATKIQLHYGTSDRFKRQQVIAYLRSDDACGSVSQQELRERFQWNIATVNRLMQGMVADGLVESFPASYYGGRGRRGLRYRLIDLI